DAPPAPIAGGTSEWLHHDGGLVEIGRDVRAEGSPETGFAFDNEGPRHRVWLEPFEIASRLVTCGDFQRFIDDGGYREPRWWLSDGWATVQQQGWKAPLYWVDDSHDGNDGAGSHWSVFGLHGLR